MCKSPADFIGVGGGGCSPGSPTLLGAHLDTVQLYVWFKISDEPAVSAVYPEDGDGKSF